MPLFRFDVSIKVEVPAYGEDAARAILNNVLSPGELKREGFEIDVLECGDARRLTDEADD